MEAPMTRTGGDGDEDRDEALERVQAALRGIRFGTVTVVIPSFRGTKALDS